MANTKVTTSSHRRYIQAVHEGLAAFEKRELEFKARERKERIMKIAHILSDERPETPVTMQPQQAASVGRLAFISNKCAMSLSGT